MNFTSLANRINDYLYQRECRKLTEMDIRMARRWSLETIRRNHPRWNEEQIMEFYDSLARVRYVRVDEAGRAI